MRRARDDRYRTAQDFQADIKALRDDYSLPTRLHPISAELVEAARQSFLRSPTPSAPRPAAIPPAATPPAPAPHPVDPDPATVRVDNTKRRPPQADDFDDMPTEIQRTDFRPRPYDEDEDEVGATEVRQDAIDMLRAARTGQRRTASPAPSAPSGPTESPEETTVKIDGSDDVTEIMREARDRLRGSKIPRR